MPTLRVTVTEEHHRRAEEARWSAVRPYAGRCANCDISQALKDLGYPRPSTDGLGVYLDYPDEGPITGPYARLPWVAKDLVGRTDRGLPIAFPVEFDLEWEEADAQPGQSSP